MKKQIFIILALIVVIGLGCLEIFYFRFHTVFQSTKVSEAPLVLEVDDQADTSDQAATLAQGSFVEIDAIHKGEGVAKLITNGQTSYLRLEDFKVTNGPDLHVYLSDSTKPGQTLASLGNYVNLGLLKGNIGDQNYILPAEYSGYRTVVIWCQQFGVLFSFAVLE